MPKHKKKPSRRERRAAQKQREASHAIERSASSIGFRPAEPLQEDHAEMSTRPSEKQRTNRKAMAMERIEHLQMLFNGVLAFCGIVALVVGGCQLRVITRQLNMMQVDQRPWIVIEPQVSYAPKEGHPFPVRFHLRNIGKTAGKVNESVQIHTFFKRGTRLPGVGMLQLSDRMASLEFEPAFIARIKDTASRSDPRIVVAPGRDMFHAVEGNAPMTPEQVQALENGEAACILLAYIRYTDGIGNVYSTMSCHLFHADTLNIEPCGAYNYMD